MLLVREIPEMVEVAIVCACAGESRVQPLSLLPAFVPPTRTVVTAAMVSERTYHYSALRFVPVDMLSSDFNSAAVLASVSSEDISFQQLLSATAF